jgi:hypothetical protein
MKYQHDLGILPAYAKTRWAAEDEYKDKEAKENWKDQIPVLSLEEVARENARLEALYGDMWND